MEIPDNFLNILQDLGGEKFKELREKYGYTQADVAKWFNCNRSNISNKETGKIPTTLSEYLALYVMVQSLGPKLKKGNPLYVLDKLTESLDEFIQKIITANNIPIKSSKDKSA